MKENRSRQRAAFLQNLAGAFLGCGIVDNNVDFFPASQMADDLGVDMRDAGELTRPVALVVRPGNPGRLVRLPLGWHAELGMSESFALAHG